MKKIFIAALLLPLGVICQQKLNLEDIWGKYAFSAKAADGFNVLKNGTSYADVEEKDGVASLNAYELKSGKKQRTIATSGDIHYTGATLNLATYQLSPNEDKLLLFDGMEYIYRHSPRASYYVYDIAKKTTVALSDKGKQMFPTFSPDGKKIAYVRDNNIYVRDLATNAEIAVTSDGELNRVKNGWADWVYEEEFSKPDYIDWSSDSRYLAYVRFDETRVREFTMDIYKGELYPYRYTFKYPKAGEDNSLVSVHIFEPATGKTVKADIGAETDMYIPRLDFTNNPSVLCIQRLNRLQNKLEYIFTNVADGSGKVIHTEESKTYVDVNDDLRFVADKGFIISSESDDYNHLYYYDLNGKLINQVTKGNWDVTQFCGFDEKTETLYYASTENGQMNRDVYSIKLNGSAKKRLSKRDGTSNFEFTTGFKYYISEYSNANTPREYELCSIDGKSIKMLEDNAELREKMKGYELSPKTFFKFTTSENVQLNGWMIRPPHFDSTKKYPVYMYAYGGPGSNECANAWDGIDYLWHQLLAQEGYIVVCVDGRGTGGRGRAFKHSTYLQMGKLETIDQIEAAKYLGKLGYVDASRIGFQGWSFGGYMAALMISKGADYIKAAVSVAPVTNWKYYDNIYTERFLRRPAENKSGYEDNSPTNFVKQIKGKYLLIHGSGDDNVHVQNSMELANAMVKYNIPFEMAIYPNKNHGISGGMTRYHLYSRVLKFVKENL